MHISKKMKNIDITSLMYSLAVIDHSGFRQAANALGVSQSALSRRVQALEETLQASLFERGSRGARLTAAGESFLEQARTALGDLSYAAANLQVAERGEAGRLRLGFYTPLSGGFLARLLLAYRNNHPDIYLKPVEQARATLISSVRKRRLDVAFVIGENGLDGCDVSELWSEPIYVVLADTHRLAEQAEIGWADLAGERFLASQAECGAEVYDHVVRHMGGVGYRPHVERVIISRDSLLSLVALNLGITLTSKAGLGLSVPGIVYRPLTSPADIVTFHAAWSPENGNPALRQFLSLAHVLAGRPRRGTSDWTGRTA